MSSVKLGFVGPLTLTVPLGQLINFIANDTKHLSCAYGSSIGRCSVKCLPHLGWVVFLQVFLLLLFFI